MNHGSLFSGIGGFDLAAEWMGWDNIFHCEWNDFGKKVLKYYWPKSISYHDITKTDFTIHRGTIDILTGGFPCQPYSTAGKRLGKEDERHLWPEMLRAIREIEPTWIVGENVRGLVSWSGGLVFEEVCADLEAQGYSVQPFLLPAAGVNAPHRRDRVWFVANSNNARTNKQMRIDGEWSEKNKRWEGQSQSEFGQSGNAINPNNERKCNVANSLQVRLQFSENGTEMGGRQEEVCGERSEFTNGFKANGKISNVTDSNSFRLSQFRQNQCGSKIKGREKTEWSSDRECVKNGKVYNRSDDFKKFPTVAPICNGDDGLSNRLDAITFPKWRNESIKAGGNAIVPQVAHQIFKAIQNYENQTKLF